MIARYSNNLRIPFRRLIDQAARLLVSLILCLAMGLSEDKKQLDLQEDDTEESALFAELPLVESASLHAQTLNEAPANVTVITAQEIREFGYRTFGEVMGNVRGFYTSDDYAYGYLGARGFNVPGDYSTRILVMVNGHYLTDNLYSAGGWLEQDFPLDLDLVARIEIIRGPSSALYGSNGVFATINVVTKSPVDHDLARVSTEVGSFGEKKVQFPSSTYLGKGANLLISTSAFNFGGRSVSFDEFNTPETSFGIAEGVDREKGHHTFMNLTWRDWSFTALASGRETHVPTGWYESIFNARGSRIKDGRSWFEALYSKDIGAGGELRWRIHYDQYRYWGRYDYDYDVGVIEDNRDIGLGDWVGSRVSYGFGVPRLGTLTFGGEVNADIRALQRNFDVQPEFFEYSSTDTPDRSYGVFVQQELNLTPQLTVYVGARFDDSKLNKPFRFAARRLDLFALVEDDL